MTPERMAGLVVAWVRLYTRGLPATVAARRIDEIRADLHDHIAHERARGTSDPRIALGIASRMVRGLAADTSWRRTRSHRSTPWVVLITALVLLVPLTAMQFTDEVAWGVMDFVLAGVLVGGAGLLLRLAVRKAAGNAYRCAAALAIATGSLLVWLVGAVGVIGADGDPADLMYGGVLAVAIVAALVARFRPEGMARALLATALAQALVAVVALIAGKQDAPGSSVAEILGLNGLFVAVFLGSAWLFRRAARADARSRPSLP